MAFATPGPQPPGNSAPAKSAASLTGNDMGTKSFQKHIKNLTKFCHTSCNGCMAALLIHSLLCTRSTTIWLGMEE
jgi:hypothetical protein